MSGTGRALQQNITSVSCTDPLFTPPLNATTSSKRSLDFRWIDPPHRPALPAPKPDRSPLGLDGARKLGAETGIEVIKPLVGNKTNAKLGVIVLLEGGDGIPKCFGKRCDEIVTMPSANQRENCQ